MQEGELRTLKNLSLITINQSIDQQTDQPNWTKPTRLEEETKNKLEVDRIMTLVEATKY